MKKFLFGLVLVTLLFAVTVTAVASEIDVKIDYVPVAFTYDSGYPFISEGRTLVPLRITMESFGAKVEWEQDTQTALVRKGNTTVRCTIGESCIYRNNVRVPNDAAAVVVNGRTYLPIRAVLEAFGATVSWDGSVNVTSPDGASCVYEVENTPSVTSNYWPIWNEAISLKSSGNYTAAIDKIRSVSKVFIEKNDSNSCAMLFKHLGECYSNLKDYANASACFMREAYYWSISTGMEQSRIDAERRSGLIKTGTQLFVKNTDISMGGKMYFNQPLEPKGSIYLGAYTEGDTNIYSPYDPSRFYMDTFPQLVGKDMAGYLLYMTYGNDVTMYQSHIDRAIEKDKILQIALQPLSGLWQVDGSESYLISLATQMQNSGCRMMLRFAGEMNDETSNWFSDPDTFIRAFRTVSSIFHQYAPDVPVIWAPNHYPPDTIDDYYPGDEYVDYVGISSYMPHNPITDPLGMGVDRGRWSSQLDNIYSLYGHKKPIIIVESGSSYMDYDTWADITPFASAQMRDFLTYLPIKYPNVKMYFVFNTDRERHKFTLSSNTTYLEAYKSGIMSPLFSSSVYSDAYIYDYYELGNNICVKAAPTELVSHITTPANDTAYVAYFINGTSLGVAYGAPYTVACDFTPYKGQSVDITVQSFDSSHNMVTSYIVKVKVI